MKTSALFTSGLVFRFGLQPPAPVLTPTVAHNPRWASLPRTLCVRTTGSTISLAITTTTSSYCHLYRCILAPILSL